MGIFAPNSAVRFADVRDGTTNTIMVAEVERVTPPTGWTPSYGTCSRLTHDGWALGGVSTMFTTNTAGNGDGAQPGGFNNNFFESAGSEHPGGAHFSMADASVRFISEHVDSLTYAALGSRAGGEVVTLP